MEIRTQARVWVASLNCQSGLKSVRHGQVWAQVSAAFLWQEPKCSKAPSPGVSTCMGGGLREASYSPFWVRDTILVFKMQRQSSRAAEVTSIKGIPRICGKHFFQHGMESDQLCLLEQIHPTFLNGKLSKVSLHSVGTVLSLQAPSQHFINVSIISQMSFEIKRSYHYMYWGTGGQFRSHLQSRRCPNLRLTIRTMQLPASYYSCVLLLNPLLWDNRKQLSSLAFGTRQCKANLGKPLQEMNCI